MLLLWISGRFGSTFVVSASLLIQTLRKRGPSRENIFSRPFRISLAKNKEGSRIRGTPPLDRSVYTLFKHSKKLYSLAKGRPSLELYLRTCRSVRISLWHPKRHHRLKVWENAAISFRDSLCQKLPHGRAVEVSIHFYNSFRTAILRQVK